VLPPVCLDDALEELVALDHRRGHLRELDGDGAILDGEPVLGSGVEAEHAERLPIASDDRDLELTARRTGAGGGAATAERLPIASDDRALELTASRTVAVGGSIAQGDRGLASANELPHQ